MGARKRGIRSLSASVGSISFALRFSSALKAAAAICERPRGEQGEASHKGGTAQRKWRERGSLTEGGRSRPGTTPRHARIASPVRVRRAAQCLSSSRWGHVVLCRTLLWKICSAHSGCCSWPPASDPSAFTIASCRASGLLESLGAERSMLLASTRNRTRFGRTTGTSDAAGRGTGTCRAAAWASIARRLPFSGAGPCSRAAPTPVYDANAASSPRSRHSRTRRPVRGSVAHLSRLSRQKSSLIDSSLISPRHDPSSERDGPSLMASARLRGETLSR